MLESFRRAQSEHDLELVQNLVQRAREAGELWAHSWPAHQIESESKEAELWLMTAKDRLLGFCLLRPPGSAWEITLIAIDPTARRKGVFRRLIEFLRQDVLLGRAALSAECVLEVREDNLAARRAYESLGFIAQGRRKSYYHDGCDALIYRWAPGNSPA